VQVGGYASLNEHGVGLAESTCNAVLAGNRSRGRLNIVDLSELGLERGELYLIGQCHPTED